MEITKFTDTGRPESEIEKNYQKKIKTFPSVPTVKQLADGVIAKVCQSNNLDLYIRNKDTIYKIGNSATAPIVATPVISGGGSAPPSGGNVTLQYDTNDFQLDGSGGLQIKDRGVHHGGLTGLEDNDHTQYFNAVSSPISATLQTLGLKYDTNDFEIDGSGNLVLKGGSAVTDHALLSHLDYAHAGHTGFEPTVTKGNLAELTSAILTIVGGASAVIGAGSTITVKQASALQNGYLSSVDWSAFSGKQRALSFGNLIAGSTKVSIDGTGTGAVIGAGVSVDVAEGNINHNALLNYSANKHIDHSAISVLAGTGMSGGGTINGNVTLNCGITQYTDALARQAISETITGITYDNTTGVFSLTSGYVIPTTTEETNWNSAYSASHSILTILDTNSINLSLTGQLLSADLAIQDTTSIDLAIDTSGLKGTVLPAGVDHDSLNNYSSNKHIDHTGVTLTAGVGLSGGGDISTNRTFTFDATELESVTWGGGAQASIVHTFNVFGVDTTMTYGNGIITASCPFNATTGFQIGTAAALGTILRGNATNFVASTFTIPDTMAINTLLYASSASILGVISPVNSAVLVTSAGGVPSESTTLPSGLTIPGFQESGNYITGLTGDVTASGPGSVAATIANSAVTLAKMANMATASLLGRNSAGAGAPEVITDIPTASTIGGKYVYRADGTDVPVADGGTGLSGFALGSIPVANTANVITALTSTIGLKSLQNNAGVITWETVTGTGAPVLATSPTFPNQITSTLAIGTKPFVITSTTLNDNLNADLLDGVHAGGLEPTVTKGNLTAGSNKISIGGTGTGSVIGAGVTVDVAQSNLDHGSIGGLSDDDHTQYVKHSLATAVSDFLVGAGTETFTFVKKTLAEVKTILGLGSAAYTASTDYAVSGKGVTNGDSHDHVGGDGSQIDHGGLGGLSDDDHSQYLRADATRVLSADWDIGNGRMIQTDKIRARDGDGLALYEDGGAGIFVQDGGNVGIGTTAPLGLFATANQIDGSSLQTYGGTHGLTGQSIFNSYYTSSANGSSGAYPRFLDIASLGMPDGTTGGGVIRFLTNPKTDNAAAVERMRINDNGNVGIGTTVPARILHIQTGDVSDSALVRIQTTGSHVAGIELLSGHGNWGVYNSDTVGDALEFRDDSAGSTRMIIDSTGNVGIGTVAPSAKLAINGGLNVGADADPGDNNLYVVGDCSALTFTDRTPTFEGKAIEAIMAIKSEGGQIDHETMPEFIRATYRDPVYEDYEVEKTNPETGEIITVIEKRSDKSEIKQGRNLGNTVSLLLKAIQEQQILIEELQSKLG